MIAKTWVVKGKLLGRFSYQCEFCGYCGGNYPDRDVAQAHANRHSQLNVPEHKPVIRD